MKTKLTIAGVVLATSTVTFIVTRWIAPETAVATGPDSRQEPLQKMDLSGLKLAPAVAGESWDVVSAAGRVGPNAGKLVKIGPRIGGKVVSIDAAVGDSVSRGQILATISSVELARARAEYRRASARLQAAEQAYRNQARLAELGAFTRRPLEEARAEHTEAQGELAQAQAELAECQSELARAESELAQCAARLQRAQELYKDQIVSRNDLEAAEAERKRDAASVEAAKSRVRQAEAKVEQLKSRVAIASDHLSREEKVAGRNLLSMRELQAARAQVTEARLELEAAADTIRVLGASPSGSGDTLSIISPISGRVVERSASLGQMVEPSDVLFVVMDLSDVWVEANVYEKDIVRVRKGQTAQVRLSGYPDRIFTGMVTHVGDVLDPASRTARVRCVVRNPAGMLKPEMFASVDIITAKRGRAVLIPRKAVLDDSGKKIVFAACTNCAEDKKAGRSVCGEYDKRQVELGASHHGRIEVVSGLKPGEQVVVEGQHQLRSALASGKLEAGCADED